MGVCNTYLIKGEGSILVDAGQQGYGDIFRRSLENINLAPSNIKLIFLSHGHWDHIGCLGDLKRITQSPIAINHRERGWVEQGLKTFPPPITRWGKVLEIMIKLFVLPKQTFPGVPIDISLSDDPFSLEPYGIKGVVYHTPGHSSGSMSLLMNTGEAFVGDLAVGGLPQRIKPNMPAFAEEPHQVIESWRPAVVLSRAWSPIQSRSTRKPPAKSGLTHCAMDGYNANCHVLPLSEFGGVCL